MGGGGGGGRRFLTGDALYGSSFGGETGSGVSEFCGGFGFGDFFCSGLGDSSDVGGCGLGVSSGLFVGFSGLGDSCFGGSCSGIGCCTLVVGVSGLNGFCGSGLGDSSGFGITSSFGLGGIISGVFIEGGDPR